MIKPGASHNLCHRTPINNHDDVIKWKHYPHWPFVRGIHRSPVNSPHKGQWRGALRFSLICVWINDSVNNGEAGDLRLYHAHYDVTVMNTWMIYFITPYVLMTLHKMIELERISIASMGNGSTSYVNQRRSYLRGENENKTNWDTKVAVYIKR